MQIGTYVIVVAVVLLIVNGPASQDYGDRTFQSLITEIYALAWSLILFLSMMVTGVILVFVDLHKCRQWFKISVLLIARATGFALNLSTGKALILPMDKFWLTVNIIVKVVSGIIYTRAIVVQSTAVQQKIFVPMNAALIVFINALTGIIIWEDWRVVQNWTGYICVFLLLALGCGLLLGDLGLLQETCPDTFRGARMTMVVKAERTKLLDNIKHFGRNSHGHGDSDNNMSLDSGDPEAAVPEGRLHQAEGDGPRNRRSVFSRQRSPRATKAWLSIYEKGGAAPRLSMAAAPQTIRWQSLRREIEAELSPNCSLLAGGASDSLGDLNFDFAPGNESPTPNPQQHTCFAEESTPNDGKKKKEQLESLDEHESEDNESHEVVETSDTVFEA